MQIRKRSAAPLRNGTVLRRPNSGSKHLSEKTYTVLIAAPESGSCGIHIGDKIGIGNQYALKVFDIRKRTVFQRKLRAAVAVSGETGGNPAGCTGSIIAIR